MIIKQKDFVVDKLSDIKLQGIEAIYYTKIIDKILNEQELDKAEAELLDKFLARVTVTGKEAKQFSKIVNDFIEQFNKEFKQENEDG